MALKVLGRGKFCSFSLFVCLGEGGGFVREQNRVSVLSSLPFFALATLLPSLRDEGQTQRIACDDGMEWTELSFSGKIPGIPSCIYSICT